MVFSTSEKLRCTPCTCTSLPSPETLRTRTLLSQAQSFSVVNRITTSHDLTARVKIILQYQWKYIFLASFLDWKSTVNNDQFPVNTWEKNWARHVWKESVSWNIQQICDRSKEYGSLIVTSQALKSSQERKLHPPLSAVKSACLAVSIIRKFSSPPSSSVSY